MKTFFCLMILALDWTAGAQGFEAMPNYVGTTSSDLSPIYSTQPGPVGWIFQPQMDISVTALGAFAYCMPADGLEVGIWNSSGVLLASNTITAASQPVGQSLYESITPVMLAANQMYFLAAYQPNSFESVVVGPNFDPPSGYAIMSPDIQLDGAAAEQNFGDNGFIFPTEDVESPGAAIVAPNFEFEAVPEPSTFCLLGTASLALLALRRRR
jgi:hypothetical protein